MIVNENNLRIENVHISTLAVGDTVIHNNKILTIGNNNINHCLFMGTSIFGDSYKIGLVPVQKVIF